MSREAAAQPAANAALSSLRDEIRSARRWQELLGEGERRRMLADIAAVALALGKDLWPDRPPSDLDVGEGEPGREACPRERIAFLESAWPRVSAALRLIEGSPPPAVAPAVQMTPTERARRVTPADVLAAAARGDLVETAAPQTGLALRLGGRVPRRVAERVFLPTFDTPANRAVKAILAQIARDLAAVAELARASGAPDVAERASALLRSLRVHHLSVSPWSTLPPISHAAAVPPLAPSLRTHGGYRALHDTWRRYRLGFGFDWANAWFTLPARETWRLYETWCLFAVADALRSLGWRATGAEGFALARGGLTFSVAPGAAVRWTFARAGEKRGVTTLTYARHFRSGGGSGDATAGWHSRSHALTPDVTLEHAGRLLVFDAKFKTYAGAEWHTEDIRQMHSYRDAIRAAGDAAEPGGGGSVDGAWLLYAGRADGASRPVIAYPASTPERPFGNGDVGALRLRPGDDAGAERLRARVAAFL